MSERQETIKNVREQILEVLENQCSTFCCDNAEEREKIAIAVNEMLMKNFLKALDELPDYIEQEKRFFENSNEKDLRNEINRFLNDLEDILKEMFK